MARDRHLQQYEEGSNLIRSFGASSAGKKNKDLPSLTTSQEVGIFGKQLGLNNQLAPQAGGDYSSLDPNMKGDVIAQPGALTPSQNQALTGAEGGSNFGGAGAGSMDYGAMAEGLKNVFANIGQKKETAPISLFNPEQSVPTTDLNQFATQPQQQPQVDPQIQALLAQLRANPNLKY